MTPNEFKAWFEGFTEACTTVPTKAQWERIKKRVDEIDGKPITQQMFIDRYWPQPTPWWQYPTWITWSNRVPSHAGQANVNVATWPGYNSTTAMHALGRADANTLTAT